MTEHALWQNFTKGKGGSLKKKIYWWPPSWRSHSHIQAKQGRQEKGFADWWRTGQARAFWAGFSCAAHCKPRHSKVLPCVIGQQFFRNCGQVRNLKDQSATCVVCLTRCHGCWAVCGVRCLIYLVRYADNNASEFVDNIDMSLGASYHRSTQKTT